MKHKKYKGALSRALVVLSQKVIFIITTKAFLNTTSKPNIVFGESALLDSAQTFSTTRFSQCLRCFSVISIAMACRPIYFCEDMLAGIRGVLYKLQIKSSQRYYYYFSFIWSSLSPNEKFNNYCTNYRFLLIVWDLWPYLL